MNTTYFDEMTGDCAVWERAKKERAERKQQIADTYGYDSPEMDDPSISAMLACDWDIDWFYLFDPNSGNWLNPIKHNSNK